MPNEDALISAAEFETLAQSALVAAGVSEPDVAIAARHFVEAELRKRGGFERLVLLIAAIEKNGAPTADTTVVLDETATSAIVDGRGRLGYTVAEQVTDLAIQKAKESGVAVVGGRNHRYSGVLGHYAERAAREGLVAIVMSSASLHLVAPYGSKEPKLSTNPIAIGVPTSGDPIVWDTAMAAIPGTLLEQALESGELLPPDSAIDAAGNPTRDPAEARAGALLPWGGHRGSGLAVMVQLLNLLCGDDAPDPAEWSATFLMIAFDPARLTPLDIFAARATEFAETIRSTQPRPDGPEVRMPADRSMAALRAGRRDGVRLSHADLRRLRDLAGARAGSA